MYQPIKIATAAILACLMLVVTTASHLGLSYCLCQDTVFLGECSCPAEVLPDNTALTPCCSSKKCSGDTDIVEKSTSEIQVTPCTNCNIKLQWELDHCSIHSLTAFKTKSNSKLELKKHSANFSLAAIFKTPSLKIITTRGSPLDLTSAPHSPVPHYIRHSVFLI